MDAVTLFDAGFTAQVCIVPPGARIAPNSKIDPKDCGKVPGILGYDGSYRGYNWMNSQPARETVVAWKASGSSVGLLTSHYPAIDVDILNERISDEVVQAVEAITGPCMIRTGRAPKRMLIFHCAAPLRSFDIAYYKWNALLGAEEKHLVQFLAQGRQFVIDGIHPTTGRGYTIEDKPKAGVLGPDALPELTVDTVVQCFKAIQAVLERYGFASNGDPEARALAQDVDQDDLKAPSEEALLELMSRAPNNLPEREEYVAVGYAIKAASQEFPEVGFEAFMDWCSRWSLGHNDPNLVQRDWGKMVPPYRSGWGWLLDNVRIWGGQVSDLVFGKAQPNDEAAIQASQGAIATSSEAAPYSDDSLASGFFPATKFLMQVSPAHPRKVLVWNNNRWEVRPESDLFHRVREYLRSRVTQARQDLAESPAKAAELAMRLGSASCIEHVTKLVKHDGCLRVEADALDADPDLINTPAGPVDLRQGKMIPPDPKHNMVRCTSVAPDPYAKCPIWDKFMAEVTQGDVDLARYLQVLAGYSLTGHTREQVFPFFTGRGGNGKSAFISVLARILGDYYSSVPVELFQHSNGNNAKVDYQLASMVGARLITTSETKAGSRWDEQRIKQLTGEDIITARKPYGELFDFNSRATLIVIGNFSPDLQIVTEAMVRRLRVVPWDFKPEVPDKMLTEKLMAELPGIMNWCLEGAKEWYRNGLQDVQGVTSETTDYIEEQDTIGRWLDSQVAFTGQGADVVTNKELYDSYVLWCRMVGFTPISGNSFRQVTPQVLRPRGARRHRGGSSRGYKGLKLEPVSDAPTNVVHFPGVAPSPENQ